MSKELEVNCPTCKKKVTWNNESTHRPFCCDHCKKIDLGEWASESYSIPVQTTDEWSGAPSDHQLSSFEQQDDDGQTFH